MRKYEQECGCWRRGLHCLQTVEEGPLRGSFGVGIEGLVSPRMHGYVREHLIWISISTVLLELREEITNGELHGEPHREPVEEEYVEARTFQPSLCHVFAPPI